MTGGVSFFQEAGVIIEVRMVVQTFFFSGRGRHTRCSRDWSSDVCSSDLCSGCGRVRRTTTRPSLSIYSDGRVGVRRTLPQPLQKGRNTFTLKLEGLDGATLFSPDTAVAVVSAVVRPATDPEAALAAAAGQTLSFVRPRTGGGADPARAA